MVDSSYGGGLPPFHQISECVGMQTNHDENAYVCMQFALFRKLENEATEDLILTGCFCRRVVIGICFSMARVISNWRLNKGEDTQLPYVMKRM